MNSLDSYYSNLFSQKNSEIRSFSIPTGLPELYRKSVMKSDEKSNRKSIKSSSKSSMSLLSDNKVYSLKDSKVQHTSDKPLLFSKRFQQSPLESLTLGLVPLYKNMNYPKQIEDKEYLARKLTTGDRTKNYLKDNANNDLVVYLFSILESSDRKTRLRVLNKLGEGAFSQVYRCRNMNTLVIEAVKVVRNVSEYKNQAEKEIKIYNLFKSPPLTCDYLIDFYGNFEIYNHTILRFPCLGPSLYELMKKVHFRGIALEFLRHVAEQLLEAADFIHSRGYIHADIKPENILVINTDPVHICLADFGSCIHPNVDIVSPYIQSRFYRAPEVLLEGIYSNKLDLWSIGCVLGELFLGIPLFPGVCEYDELYHIMEGIGTIPMEMITSSPRTKEFYNIIRMNDQFIYQFKDEEQYYRENPNSVTHLKRHIFEIKSVSDRFLAMKYDETKNEEDRFKDFCDRLSFVDLVTTLLQISPSQRYSAKQALQHPFIQNTPYNGHFEPSPESPPQTFRPQYDEKNRGKQGHPGSYMYNYQMYNTRAVQIYPSLISLSPVQDPNIVYRYASRCDSIAPLYVRPEQGSESPIDFNSPQAYRESRGSLYEFNFNPQPPKIRRGRSMTVSMNPNETNIYYSHSSRSRSSSLQSSCIEGYPQHYPQPYPSPLSYPHPSSPYEQYSADPIVYNDSIYRYNSVGQPIIPGNPSGNRRSMTLQPPLNVGNGIPPTMNIQLPMNKSLNKQVNGNLNKRRGRSMTFTQQGKAQDIPMDY